MIELEKAYDKVDWVFLYEILRCFGFSQLWRNLVMQCVSTVSFSVLLDGSPFGFFKPSRGLRQGNPLSAFLFILGMEVLSCLVLRGESEGSLHGLKIARHAPPIAHLLFANDLMFFLRANPREVSSLRVILNMFELWTAQTTHLTKSFVSFSNNMNQDASSRICGIMRLAPASDLGVSSGLPSVISKSKSATFLALREKVQRRVAGWKAKALSQAGRTVLIKTVASALPSYVMSVFLLLKGFCHCIHRMLKNFWWGFPDRYFVSLSPQSLACCLPA